MFRSRALLLALVTITVAGAIPLASAVESADLSIQNVAPATISKGNNLTYTITVTNTGPSGATGTFVTHPVLSGLTFISGSSSCKLNAAGNKVICGTGTIRTSQSKVVTVTYSTVNASCGVLSNTATVAGQQPDPNSSNNSSTAVTQVTCPTGNLYVTNDVTPVKNRMLLGGQLSDTIQRLQFHADGEDVDVTDIQLTATSATLVSVDRLELYRDGDVTPFGIATIGSCGADPTPPGFVTFCAQLNNGELIVPNGQDIDVLVRALLKTDVDGAISGEIIRFFVHEGASGVRARGVQSLNTLAVNDGDATAEGEVFIGRSTPGASIRIIGQKHVSVLSKITSVTNASPDANGTAVPTGVSAIGQFKFTAADHANSLNGLNRVTMSAAIFNVTATNVQLNANAGQFKLYNKIDANTTANCTAVDSLNQPLAGTVTGNFFVRCKSIGETLFNLSQIAPGQDATLVLQAYVTNPKTGSAASLLQVSLQNFSIPFISYFHPFGSHFLWLDQDNLNPAKQFLWFEYPETVVNSTAYQS